MDDQRSARHALVQMLNRTEDGVQASSLPEALKRIRTQLIEVAFGRDSDEEPPA